MQISPATLVIVAKDFLARYDAATQHQARADLAYEAVGMLRAWVRGSMAAEAAEVRLYEAIAHIPDDEDNAF